jgi:hypothetical protein
MYIPLKKISHGHVILSCNCATPVPIQRPPVLMSSIVSPLVALAAYLTVFCGSVCLAVCVTPSPFAIETRKFALLGVTVLIVTILAPD